MTYELHKLKISTEDFNAIELGIKNFEIRKNDRDYQVGDFLLLKEFHGQNFTGLETLRQITYMTDYQQKDNYVVLSFATVPKSFANYLSLTSKEQKVFQSMVNYTYIYGYQSREVSNAIWEAIEILIGNNDLSTEDQKWYMKYWGEDD